MTTEEKVQLEIDTHIKGKRYSLAYKKQFVKDVAYLGYEYVSDKYSIYSIDTISCMSIRFKFDIDTVKNIVGKTVINNMSDEEQLEFIQYVRNNSARLVCDKYNIKGGSIRYWHIKLCKKFNIEYIALKTPILRTIKEKENILEDYDKFGKNYIIKKYNFSGKKIHDVIRKFRSEVNEKVTPIEYRTEEEKFQILEDYNLHGKDYVSEKYNINAPIYAVCAIKRNIQPENVRSMTFRTEDEKKQILEDYNTNGTKYTAKKYSINIKSMGATISDIRKFLNITETKYTYRSNEEKLQILEDYKNYGTKYVFKKYNISSTINIPSMLYAFRKQLGIN